MTDASMILGVMPGVVGSVATLFPARSVMSAGRDDLGRPFDSAAAAILFGSSVEIFAWNMALPVFPYINHAELWKGLFRTYTRQPRLSHQESG